MSAVAIFFQFLLALLGFLSSLLGIFVFLSGVLLFLILPIIPRMTGYFHRFANLHLWLATSMLKRAAIVVSEHGDLLLKRMTFDDLGVEKISFDNDEKEFEDPDAALHYWLGIPFALADEVHGVLFDPRHAALGMRKNAAKERGEYTANATQNEWENYSVHKWVRGVFEFPRDTYELVNLRGVRHLVDGGERAEYPKRVEELYRHSRAPFQSGTSATRYFMIIVALLAPFGMMWFIASQGSGSGGGSTVGYNVLLFLAGVKGALGSIRDIDWKGVAVALLVFLPLPVIFLLAFIYISPLTAILAFVALGMGFWAVPIITQLFKASSFLSGAIAPFLVRLGFSAYDKLVFVWRKDKYVLREYSELDEAVKDGVTWYGLEGSLVGFTFEPGPESWGPEVVDKERLDAKTEVVTDGGQPSASNIPAGYTRAPDITRGDVYSAFVPRRLDEDSYYLNTGIAQSRFSDSANGEKALNRLLWAKEKYGGDNSLSDKAIVYAMAGCGVFSTVLGVWIFFL